MHTSILNDILYLAREEQFQVVPAAGHNWKGDFDLGKQPLISIHEASSDQDTIRMWAEKYPRCNWLGVPRHGEVRLDDDPRHGGDHQLQELEAKYGPLPLTPKVRTGGGGFHFYFTCDPSVVLCTDLFETAGLTLVCGPRKGFVLPPCIHKSGKPYAFEYAPWDVPTAPCPAWLLNLAISKTLATKPKPSGIVVPTTGPLQFVWGGCGLADHPGEAEGGRPSSASPTSRRN